MKKCPQCDLENPSKANFCLRCGAALRDDVLPEDILLKKKLEEANATIEVLRNSLTIAQQQLSKSVSVEELELLQAQMGEKEQEVGNLKKTISKLSTIIKNLKASEPVKIGKWGWIFVFLFVSAAILSILLWDNNDGLESTISKMKVSNSNEVSKLQANISKLQANISEQAESLRQSEEEKRKISEEFEELKVVRLGKLSEGELEARNLSFGNLGGGYLSEIKKSHNLLV